MHPPIVRGATPRCTGRSAASANTAISRTDVTLPWLISDPPDAAELRYLPGGR